MTKAVITRSVLSVLFILCITFLPACGGGGGGDTKSWNYVGSSDGISAGGAGSPSLFVYSGTPYLAYLNDSDGKITVKKYNGSSWEVLGSEGFTPASGQAADISLYVFNGTPYVAYRATTDNSIRVMVYNNPGWTTIGGGSVSLALSGNTSLYVYNNIPYVAFKDSAQKVAVYYYNSGWVQTGGASVGTGVSTISLSGYNGVLYLALDDSSTVKVMKSNGGVGDAWSQVGLNVSTDSAYFISLAMDNDTPYVAYQDGSYKIHVFKYSGSWQAVGLSTLPGGVADVSYTRLHISNGVPYIAFQDGFTNDDDKMTVMQFNGSQWATVGPSEFTPANTSHLGFYVYNGVPYVAYNHQSIIYKIVVQKYD